MNESTRRRLRQVIVYGLLAAGAVFVVRATLLAPPAVKVAAVVREDVVNEIQATGEVTVDELAVVGSKIAGRIVFLRVDEGDLVKSGEVVAKLEDTDLRRELEVVQARHKAARATAWEIGRELERQKELLATGAVSTEDTEGVEERYRVAQARVEEAQAEVRFREFKLSETEIPTFLGGLVVRRWVEPGAAVVAGQPVVTIAGTSRILLAANVDQYFSGDVKAGQPATVLLRGRTQAPITGQVYRVNPNADPVTEELLVEVAFDLPPKQLHIGHWAETYIQVGTAEKALTVSRAALMPLGDRLVVFVVKNQNRVRRVNVEIIASSPRYPKVAIVGDIEEGDRVVLNPRGLEDGAVVNVTASKATN